jgi:transcriptional regulator with XRE-family HTH domain
MVASTAEVPFAALLKRLREASGLTQEALAERAGLSARSICLSAHPRSRRDPGAGRHSARRWRSRSLGGERDRLVNGERLTARPGVRECLSS